jgi:hypothetical protein
VYGPEGGVDWNLGPKKVVEIESKKEIIGTAEEVVEAT